MVRRPEQAGYRAGKTLYGLPYDWRLAPSENKICPDLAQLVTHVTNTTAHRKVEALRSSSFIETVLTLRARHGPCPPPGSLHSRGPYMIYIHISI